MRDDALLLIQRGTEPGKGLWSLPGGRVELGETMAEAVVREFQEEVGLDAVCGPLVGWVERISTDFHFAIFDFVVTLLGDVGASTTPVAGDDADAAAAAIICFGNHNILAHLGHIRRRRARRHGS